MSNLWWFSCLFFLGYFNIISAQCQYPGTYGPGYGAPYPVYMDNRDNDSLRSILPILLLMLTDGGFGGGFGGGCGHSGGCGGCGCGCGHSGGSTIPIPYPIPIPINNPIITL